MLSKLTNESNGSLIQFVWSLTRSHRAAVLHDACQLVQLAAHVIAHTELGHVQVEGEGDVAGYLPGSPAFVLEPNHKIDFGYGLYARGPIGLIGKETWRATFRAAPRLSWDRTLNLASRC